MALTIEAVRALAPDASALRAGQTLASPARWSGLGRSDRALWGACQGSGKDPYQVSVDVGSATPAAKCTCPSRKFPCKHALGLMLMAAANAAALPAATPPQATTDWLASRDTRAKAAPAARAAAGGEEDGGATRVVDEKARARRVATRERRVESGLDEFKTWLRDLARRGLAEVVSEGYKPFDAMAARLVDAQASSIARVVRGVGWRVAAKGQPGRVEDPGAVDWADDLLDVIGRLHLLVETNARRETLSPGMQAEVRTLVGWTVREAELPDDDLVEDDWLVAGRRHTGDERLRATRTYLRGRTSGRYAALLDWEPSNSDPSNEPPVGAEVHGSLVYYPSATPIRAAVRGTLADAGGGPEAAAFHTAASPTTWREAIAPYATALATNPWLERQPVVVTGVTPVREGDAVVYRDAAGETVACRFAEPAIESLRSFAGGHPVTLFGEWDGSALTVLAAAQDGAWVPLAGTTDAAPTVAVGRRGAADTAAWTALRAWAILGTSRAAPGPELEPLVGRMADRSAPEQILAIAASLAVRRRAQAALQAVPEAETIAPAPSEVGRRASPASVRVLREWLGEPVVVGDWLDHAAAAGVLVPPELLPSVLAIANVARRPDASIVLGKRWRWFSGAASGSVDALALARTATGTGDFHVALGDPAAAGSFGPEIEEILHAFRAHDPATARGWIDAAWGSLAAKAKDGAVKALATGAGAGDGPFIDRVFAEEKAKGRREELATLACRAAAGSALGTRIEARAREMVSVRGLINKTVDVIPPGSDVLEAMERDGMPALSYGPRVPVQAAARVEHAVLWHVGVVAPARWTEWLRLRPGEVVGAFAGFKRTGPSLTFALRNAAIAHRDIEFAEAMLAAPPGSAYGWPGAGLWSLVPEDKRERLMVKLLFDRSAANDWTSGTSLGEALAVAPRPWSPGLVTLVRHEINRNLAPMSATATHIARMRMQAIATNAPPSLLAELEESIAAQAPKLDNPSTFDTVQEIVVARRAVDAAFAA